MGVRLRRYIKIATSIRARYALPGALGDAHLLKINPIYRSVRQKVVALGYTFDNDPHAPYFQWHLMHLDAILRKKKFPYWSNLSAVRAVERTQPGQLTLAHILKVPPQKNYVLHESAHVIAETTLKAARLWTKIDPVAKALYAEACANSLEAFASSFLSGEMANFSFSMNSYFISTPARKEILKRLRHELGDKAALKLLVINYLAALHLVENPNPAQQKFWIQVVAPELKITSAVGSAADGAWTLAQGLNLYFRTTTNAIYLRQTGISNPMVKIKARAVPRRFNKLLETLKPSLEILCECVVP